MNKKDNLECNRQKGEKKKKAMSTKQTHMLCWPTIIQCRNREPEGSIVSAHHRAALTDSSAVSKADTVSHRGKIVKGERGRSGWRTRDIYWYGHCSSRCPSVRVPYCLDINHYCHEAQEISTLVSPTAFFLPCFKPAWSIPVCELARVCVCLCVFWGWMLLEQMKWFGVKWLWVILND